MLEKDPDNLNLLFKKGVNSLKNNDFEDYKKKFFKIHKLNKNYKIDLITYSLGIIL